MFFPSSWDNVASWNSATTAMAVTSSVPFLSRANPSTSSSHAQTRVVPYPAEGDIGLKWPAQTYPDPLCGQGRSCKERTTILNCVSSSLNAQTVSPRGLDDISVDAGRRMPQGSRDCFEGLGSRKFFGSEIAVSEKEQRGLAEPASRIMSSRKKVLEGGEQGVWSIVIPTYNRLPILLKCLQSLEGQRDYSLAGIDSYEVIVVDDGSTDGTVDFLETGTKNSPKLVECEENILRANGGICGKAGGYYEGGGISERIATTSGRGVDNISVGSAVVSSVEGEDDGVLRHSERFPHVKLIQQKHGGATKARNLGLKYAIGAVIVFIDSDLIVTGSFLKAHGEALRNAIMEDGDDRAFTYGRVVKLSEKLKITNCSTAYFATGNVAISRQRLFEAGKLLGGNADGPFDDKFSEYGWEDLELGVRLRQCGAQIRHAPAAVGFHWHPSLCIEQLPNLIEQVLFGTTVAA